MTSDFCHRKITELGLLFASATWWRHQMETFSALLTICAGKSPVPGEFPAQRAVTPSFDVFFELRPNKRMSKHWWGWWFETPSRPLWRHCNEMRCHEKSFEEIARCSKPHSLPGRSSSSFRLEYPFDTTMSCLSIRPTLYRIIQHLPQEVYILHRFVLYSARNPKCIYT